MVFFPSSLPNTTTFQSLICTQGELVYLGQ
jgi:hypothetical protein